MNRSLALLLVGLWVGLVFTSWALATGAFRTADEALEPSLHPELTSRLEPLAPDQRRSVVRFMAAEMNRWMFRTWSLSQIAISLVLLFLVRHDGRARLLVGIALLVLLVQAIGLAPAIARLGRSLDFVPRPLPLDVARRFGWLHGAYVLLDLLKAGVVFGLGWVLGRAP